MREFTRQLLLNSTNQSNSSAQLSTDNLQSFSIIPSFRTQTQTPLQNQGITEIQSSDSDITLQPLESISPIQNQIQTQALETTKIGIFLKDPAIQAIECQGPNKPLSIKRNNQVLTSPVTLEETEIQSIIQSLSINSNTRIQENTLKATTQDYSATGFISDFAGSRFTIYKTPYQQIQ